MKKMKKVMSVLLTLAVILTSTVIVLPAYAENAITLSTTDTHTVVDMAALGFSGDNYSIAKGESLSFSLVVPETEASTYQTVILGGAANDVVQVDITAQDGTSVFSKTHTLFAAGGGIVSGKKGYDGEGANVVLEAGTYTVTLTNMSSGAFVLNGMEFRDVVLPLGKKKTVFHIKDAYSWWVPWYHISSVTSGKELNFGNAKIVGGNNYSLIVLDKAQNGYMFHSVYAEEAGEYYLSSYMDAGTGAMQVKVNNGQTVTFPVATESGVVKCETPVMLNEGLNLFDINTVSGQATVYNLIMEPLNQTEDSEADVTLNTEDTYTKILPGNIGLSGSPYSIATGESISFTMSVPETEASKYISIIHSTTVCDIKMDIVSENGTVVFSKTQGMFRAGGDLFSGISGHAKDLDGAVIDLAAGTYTVTLTTTSDTACGFQSLEFRNVVLPMGTEKTAFHVTDGFYQNNMSWHTCAYGTPSYTVPETIPVVGGRNVYEFMMHQAQGAHMKYYVYAEKAGQYEFSVRSNGTGGLMVKANDDAAVLVSDKEAVSHDWRFDTAAETIKLNQGLNTVQLYATNGGQSSVDCFILEPAHSAVTLNTEDIHTVITPSDIGLSGESYPIPVGESISFRLVVPASEAGTYQNIIYGGGQNDTIQYDITAVDGTAVFSKAHTMVLTGGGLISGKKGYDGADGTVTLATGSYIVSIKNTSATAFAFERLELRDVLLPLGMEKTTLRITDAFNWWVPWYHATTFKEDIAIATGDNIVVGGDDAFDSVVLDRAQNGYMFMSVNAEKAGKYKIFSHMTTSTGQMSLKVNGQTVTFPLATAAMGEYEASDTVTLVEGYNELEITSVSGYACPYTITLELQEQTAEDYAEITLNTQDTNTLVTISDMGLSGASYSIAKNKKIGFKLVVPESEASKYIAILRGNTTGPVLKLEVTDENGTAVFSKMQDMTLANDTFSGVMGEGSDADGAVMELSAGTYTVTLQNTSDKPYDFVSLELRDVVLPLGSGKTAFHTTDAYYQNLLWWHSSRFTGSQGTPYGATAVGGEAFYPIVFKQQNGPDVRYYVYAEEAGEYEISVRVNGCGGIVAKVNDAVGVTVSPMAATAFTEYQIDTFDGTVTLNQGLNTIAFSSIGTLIETNFDCFMLERVESIWAESNALYVTDIQEKALSVQWNVRLAGKASSFDLYQNGTLVANVDGNANTYTFENLKPASSYELAVKANMADGTNYDLKRKITAYTGNFLARENAFSQISAGRSHFIGINFNGELQSFGSNNYGQSSTAFLAEPKAVEAGASSSYAVDKDGFLYSWGSNFFGQLGLGTDDATVAAPAKVPGLSGVVQVAAGNEHVLVLCENGDVYAFGHNRYGQLGIGNMNTITQKNAPVKIEALSGKDVVKIATGMNCSYAITADGTLYSWGANFLGQLGDGNAALDNRDLPNAVTISGYKVFDVAGGGAHTVALCYKDANGNGSADSGEEKAVYVWGADSRAQLGFGDLGHWQNAPKRQTALDGLDVISVACGDGHSLVLTADGTIYSWGWNEDGQLGLGTVKYAFTPTRVYNIPKISAISAGFAYSVALAEDGRTYAWGTNVMQQITDSASVFFASPVVMNLSLENISIGELKFTNEAGETKDKPRKGGTYTVSANCYNDSTEAFYGNVHVCVYQLSGGKTKLLGAMPVEMQIDGKKTTLLTSEITLPEVTDNVIVKLFAWDTNLKSHSDTAIVK